MRIKRSAGVLLALLLVSTASRAFMLGGTRVVVYQDEGSSLLKVIGSSSDPLSLIRSRVTRSVDDNHQVANFFVTPPLFRLEPGGRSMLRISLLSPKGLPVDRESLFYLKVAGIPATNPLARNSRQGFAGASLLLGTGNIIKVFYRPHGIGAPTVDNWRQLRWQRVPGGFRITNPTPWTVTFPVLLTGIALLSLPALWGDTLSQPVLSRVTALWLAGLVLLGVSTCRLSRGGAARLGDAVVAAGVAAAVTVYVQVLAPDPQAVWMPAAGDGRPSGLFMQVNCMASFLATALGVATLLALRGHRRGLMGVALGVIGPALVCCQSTVGVLGASLVVVALLLLARYYRVLVVLVAVAGIALGGLAGWQVIDQVAQTPARPPIMSAPVVASSSAEHAHLPLPDLATGLDHADGRAARVILWRAAWRQWMTHPFFGTGMGSFPRVFPEVLRDPVLGYRWEDTPTHPHNELLFQAVEGGLVAVSGLLLIVGWGLWRTYLAWRATAPVGGLCAPRGDAAGWLVCCLPIALHAMVELPMYQSPLHVLVPVLLAGIGVARSGSVAGGRVWTAPPRLAPWLRALGVVVALAATVQCINNARVAGAVSVAVRSSGADIQPLRDALRWNPWVDPDEVGLGGLARSVWLYNHLHDEALRASAQAWLSDYLTRHPSPEMYRTLLQLERAGGDMTAYRQTLARAQYLFPWSSLIPATPEP